MKDLQTALAGVIKNVFDVELEPELTRPDEQFGDYATNVALQLAGPLHKNPREVAELVVTAAKNELGEQVSDITVAGPGFINLRLSDAVVAEAANQAPHYRPDNFKNKVVVAEYSDPNPFKMLHAGHIYTTVVGDAIANLFETAGATVHRVNFGGDVGLHVGKTMWSILKYLGGEQPEKLQAIEPAERPAWLAARYVEGNNAYEESEALKTEIVALNKRVYRLHSENDHDSLFAHIYWTCRQWSYEAFDAFYARLGTKLEKYYPESETADLGLRLVKEQIGKVFEESDGAVVFKGEPFGLHTRVFINREGLPTYEAKDVGLIVKKYEDYHFDRSVVITANEQEQYMGVVLKAIEQFRPDLAQATTYVPHGMVKLAGGVKMSSRKGNIVPAHEVLNVTSQAIADTGRPAENTTMLGAIKYAFLKVRIGGDIIYDPAESVSLEGNSGPYLQYAHARARSILRKSDKGQIPKQGQALSGYSAEEEPEKESFETTGSKAGPRRVNGTQDEHGSAPELEFQQREKMLNSVEFQKDERSLARKISEYAETVDKAVAELMPHHICTYLYELAQTFNRFYEHNRVLDDPREKQRLALVARYANTLKAGLELLGITAPDQL